MDVTFEPSRGKDFTIEIGYFDTVREIKEKILKYQGFPIANQTLIFNGQVMVDERDTVFYEILHKSHVQLQLKNELPKAVVKTEDSSSSSSSASMLQLIIKFPNAKKQFSVDMEATDTVMKLKEKIQLQLIQGMERLPLNRFSLTFNGNELIENRSLEHYAISNLSEIAIFMRPMTPSTPSTPQSSNGGGGSPKKLRLMVLPKGGAQKIQVEVNAGDNVGELRKELQKLQQKFDFSLPSEGYFFIYKQNVMDDDRSFRWHEVKQGDTIEIFNGSVTGGS